MAVAKVVRGDCGTLARTEHNFIRQKRNRAFLVKETA